MKKYFIVGLIAALSPSVSFGYSARINDLIAQKQAKMKQLEKCQGTTKNLKIAGLSTLGITAVGVGANIAEAVVLNQYDDKIGKAEKARDEAKTKYENKLNKQIEKEETARKEREKNTHKCNSDETPSSFADAIKKANDSAVPDCNPKNGNKFNEHNCEATDLGVITCTLNINGQEHTYIHTFNVTDQPCEILEENLIVDNIQDAEDKIKEVLKIQDINCDFDDNVATCYDNKNMFQRYKCTFKEIRSSSSDNGLKVYNTVSEFKDVHLNKSKAQEQFKRLVTWYADKKSDKYIDVDSCSKLVTANGQGSSRCNSKENNVYIFKFAAIDSTVSVKPSLVKYFCESSFNGEYKSVSRECTVANESVQACVEYIMDNKGTADKCTPSAEEETEANISEIPVFKDSISLFEDKNLDQAMRLIKWYDPDVDASNCKVKTKRGIFKQDHVTCGEKRFMFYDLTASKSTAKDSLTKYFCTEFSGGSVNDGKCSGNDAFVQKCVEHVMNGDGECLTPQGVAKQLENEKKEKERIEAEVEKKINERKQKYCRIMECEVDKCYVIGKDNFWKVKCSDKKDTTPVCFKKDDNDNKKYDCDEGITLEEKASREQEKKDKEQSRKDTFCPIVGCPEASCQIRDIYDINRSGFIKLTCSGNSDKNGCFKEGSTDDFYDCDTLKLDKKVTQIKGKWFVNHAEEYLKKQGLLKKNCVPETDDNKIVCGKKEYQFSELIDVELDNDKFRWISASNKEDAKQQVMEYTKNACTSVRVEKNVATCYISTNDSPAKVSHKFEFLSIEKSK